MIQSYLVIQFSTIKAGELCGKIFSLTLTTNIYMRMNEPGNGGDLRFRIMLKILPHTTLLVFRGLQDFHQHLSELCEANDLKTFLAMEKDPRIIGR